MIELEQMTTNVSSAKAGSLKVKFQAKAIALILSVVSLSWVFEGFRQIKAGGNVGNFAILISALLATTFLLWIQAFWIYVEEKSKGTLKRKIAIFESMEKWFQLKDRSAGLNTSGMNGDTGSGKARD